MKLNVADVAPDMLLYVVPPSVLTCHCTVGAGEPLAAAVNVTVAPEQNVPLDGFVLTIGVPFTVSAAAVVVALPQVLVYTARYLLPFCELVVVNDRVLDVAPDILE